MDHEPQLLAAVDEVNNRQKLALAGKIEAYFADQGGVKGRTLALWGLAFKANTDDVREASALAMIRDLTAKGMRIRAFDPVAKETAARDLGPNDLLEMVDDQYEALEGADALAVVTEWNQFRNPDFARVRGMLSAPLVFDGRNLYSPRDLAEAGFAYFCIGRPDPK